MHLCKCMCVSVYLGMFMCKLALGALRMSSYIVEGGVTLDDSFTQLEYNHYV